MSELNQRIAELIGDEAIVTYKVMDGEKCIDEKLTQDAAERFEFRQNALPKLRIKPHSNYRPYDTELKEAWRAAERFAERITPEGGRVTFSLTAAYGQCCAAFRIYQSGEKVPSGRKTGIEDTPALAICAAIEG